jgi:hypothetical protein
MNEIAQMVSQKFNVSPEISQQIVQFLVAQLKTKLPEGMGSQLDSLMQTGASPDSGGLMDKVKSMAASLTTKQ